MSGIIGMNDWERSLSAGRRVIADKLAQAHIISYTPDGCQAARFLFLVMGKKVCPKLTGWEIVKIANDEILKGFKVEYAKD